MQSEIRGTEESNQVFKTFFAQPDNAKCFECNADAKEFVSVNNGISLCEKCAGVHRNFGDHISLVKSVHSPEWASSELKLLEHGGNAKLKEFFSAYNFDASAAPVLKYKTLAAFYYRRKLRFESEGKEHPEMPSEKDKHLEEHENESFFDTLTAGWTGLKASIKAGVTNAVEFIKEKTSGTTAEDVKDAAKDKAADIKSDAKDVAAKASDKKDELTKDAKDLAAKASDKKDEVAEKVEEKTGGLKESLIDAKDKAVDMASKGIEAVKGQVSTTVGYVKEKAGDLRENINEKTEAAKETLTDAKDKAVDMASKGMEAVKGQVNTAVDFIKEKAQGTTTEDVKDAAKDAKDAVKDKAADLKSDAKDVAAKASDKKDEVAKDLSDKKAEVADKVEEKTGGLKETLIDAKDRAVDMASKGIEAVKGQVTNAVDFIKEKTHTTTAEDVKDAAKDKAADLKSDAKDVAAKASDKKDEVADKAEEKAGGLMGTITDLKDKAVDMASKGIEAAKDQVSHAVEFIKEKAHIEGAHPEGKEGDKKEGDEKKGDEKEGDKKEQEGDKKEKELEVKDVVHKTEEQLQQEKEIAEKKAKEEAQLQEIANEAAEAVKTQTMPHTTKSKADQIREQAAMVEAARGKTRVSKGKGVKKQVVQKAGADLEYIEKLQHAGEGEEHDDEEGDEEEEEHPEGTQDTKEKSQEETKESKQTGDTLKEGESVGQKIKDKIVGTGEEGAKTTDEAAGNTKKVSSDEHKEETFEKVPKINK